MWGLLSAIGEARYACSAVSRLRRQVAVQTYPAMLMYLRARRAGSSACQADTRPGLKALEQKRKRSVIGRVRKQAMMSHRKTMEK